MCFSMIVIFVLCLGALPECCFYKTRRERQVLYPSSKQLFRDFTSDVLREAECWTGAAPCEDVKDVTCDFTHALQAYASYLQHSHILS